MWKTTLPYGKNSKTNPGSAINKKLAIDYPGGQDFMKYGILEIMGITSLN